jgi:hypothetical protein
MKHPISVSIKPAAAHYRMQMARLTLNAAPMVAKLSWSGAKVVDHQLQNRLGRQDLVLSS